MTTAGSVCVRRARRLSEPNGQRQGPHHAGAVSPANHPCPIGGPSLLPIGERGGRG
jgi:hypothetical protein